MTEEWFVPQPTRLGSRQIDRPALPIVGGRRAILTLSARGSVADIRELASRIGKRGLSGQAPCFCPRDESGHLYFVTHNLRKREFHEFLRPNVPHAFQQDSGHYRGKE